MRGTKFKAVRCAVECLEPRRLFSFGSLDPSFGGTGVIDIPETGAGLSFNATEIKSQTDGKIVVVGTTSDHRIGVARFNLNGTLDSTFGSGGESLFHFSSGHDEATSFAIQTDGKILVAGAEHTDDKSSDGYFGPGSSEGPGDIAVARLTAAGKLDTSFGDSGVFTQHFSSTVHFSDPSIATAVMVTTSGQIMLTGTIRQEQLINSIHDNLNFIAMRLNSNGKRDLSYGSLGSEVLDLGGGGNNDGDYANDATLDYTGTASTNPNFGKLVIVGANYDEAYDRANVAILRLTTRGFPDGSFGNDGVVLQQFPGDKIGIAHSVVIAPNDDIVVGGKVWAGATNTNYNFGILAFKNNGKLDTSFGSGGVNQLDFNNKDDYATSLIIDEGGDFILGGDSGGSLAMAAFTSAGKFDVRFNNGMPLTLAQPDIRGLAVGADQTILATSAVNTTTERFFDMVPIAAIGSLGSSAYEQGNKTASFLVTLSNRVSYARDVYIGISGSATLSTLATIKFKTADYTLNGITLPSILSKSTTPYVVIPANFTFAQVTLTPIDDARVEGDETAIFSIIANPSYDLQPIDPNNPLGTVQSVTLTIHDNDGATQSFGAKADAYVRDGSYANTNFGTANQLDVKDGPSGLNRQSYLRFDLSSLSSVNSVKLQLYGALSAASATPIAAQVFGVASTTWSETTIDYNNKPASSGSSLGTISVADTNVELYTLDITAYVKQQFAAGKKVVSLLLKAPATSNPQIEFESREAANGPQLIVS